MSGVKAGWPWRHTFMEAESRSIAWSCITAAGFAPGTGGRPFRFPVQKRDHGSRSTGTRGAPFRWRNGTELRKGPEAPSEIPTVPGPRGVSASGDRAQQRKGSFAALQAAADRSLSSAEAEQALSLSTINGAELSGTIPGSKVSRVERRNGRCASRSPSAASSPSSSPGNSLSPSSEKLPATLRFCTDAETGQPVSDSSIPSSASAAASRDQRPAGDDIARRCRQFENIRVPPTGERSTITETTVAF